MSAKQKAFCKDFDRLRGALVALNQALLSIPSPADSGSGSIGEPPTEHGGFNMAEIPPGVFPWGWIVSHPGGVYFVTEWENVEVLLELENHGVDGFAWRLMNLDAEFPVDHTANNLSLTYLFARWTEAREQGLALLEFIGQAVDWMTEAVTVITTTSGVDNEAAREGIAEAVAKLEEMKVAWNETIKKWRQH